MYKKVSTYIYIIGNYDVWPRTNWLNNDIFVFVNTISVGHVKVDQIS